MTIANIRDVRALKHLTYNAAATAAGIYESQNFEVFRLILEPSD